MLRIERFEAVEINVPAGSTLTRFYFPDLPNLRNAKVTAIQVNTTSNISATPLTGSVPVSTEDLKKSFLTLYDGDLQLIYNIPVLNFNNVNGAGSMSPAPYVFELPAINGITISWVKSYVVLPTAIVSTSPVAYSFGIYYHF